MSGPSEVSALMSAKGITVSDNGFCDNFITAVYDRKGCRGIHTSDYVGQLLNVLASSTCNPRAVEERTSPGGAPSMKEEAMSTVLISSNKQEIEE